MNRGRETSECQTRFEANAPGEDAQFVFLLEAFEKTRLRKPAFAQDQAVAVAVRPQEEIVEPVDDGLVINLDTQIGGNLLRKRPIVVPAALVLVILDEVALDAAAGEEFDGLHDAFAVGFGHLRQHAVHIKND